MTLVDSCGWLEYFKDDALADAYEPHLRDHPLVVPTVVLYEVYKVLTRDLSEAMADVAVTPLRAGLVVPLDGWLALEAADLSLTHSLSMADAIVYATARAHEATLVTSDEHFRDLPAVEYIPKA